MARDAAELAHRLARDAEAVCRHYLSNGRRQGRYWLVGDVRNTPGRSLFVRLRGHESGKGAAGKWTDAASGEHGDLLDVIRESCGLVDFHDVADEARRFLSLPQMDPEPRHKPRSLPAPVGSSESARRLFAMSQPIPGTLVETHLRNRGITDLRGTGSLRFHPRCYYRPDEYSPTETWPAMIAAVTDLKGKLTGAHRTWLDPDGFDPVRLGKAPIDTPRRSMGCAYAIVEGVDGRTHHLKFSDLDVTGDARPGSIVETRAYEDANGRKRLSLATRSDFDIEAQVTARGATWLDRQILARDPVASGSGFGAEVREAMDRRVDHLVEEGLARRQGQRVVFARDLLDTLRRRELDQISSKFATETGLPHRPSAEGEHVGGVYRQRFALASGRFALLDDGLGFQLVPWRPALEQRLGQHISGTMTGRGVDWDFARGRSLGI